MPGRLAEKGQALKGQHQWADAYGIVHDARCSDTNGYSTVNVRCGLETSRSLGVPQVRKAHSRPGLLRVKFCLRIRQTNQGIDSTANDTYLRYATAA